MRGMPSKRVFSPAARRRSAAAAAWCASSAVWVTSAFSFGLNASIRARKWRVSSTLEIFLFASKSANSPMDRLCSIASLFNDPWHDVKAGLHARRVCLVLFVLVVLGHGVGTQALALAHERVSHGWHGTGVHLRQICDEVDDTRKARHVNWHLLSGDRQSREVRDLLDFLT